MQPDFKTLKPVSAQPDFSSLKPVTSSAPVQAKSLSDSIWSGLSSAGNAIGNALGGNKLGEDIGTLGGYGLTAAKEKLGLVPKGSTSQYDLSAPSPLAAIGDAAKVGATVIGAGLGGGTGASVAARIGSAALKYGSTGAVFSGGDALANNKSAEDVAISAGKGFATGAITAGVGQSFGEGIKALFVGNDSYNSALKDVTPDFSQATPTEKAKLLPRTQEGGIFKGRKVVPTTTNEDAAAALSVTNGYNSKATNLEKSQLIRDAISQEGTALKTALQNEKVILPKKEIVSVIKTAIDDVPEESLLLQKSDPVLDNYMRVARNAADQSDGTLKGVLDIRQKLDAAYENARGKLAFGSDKISALDDIHSASRDALNEYLISHAPNVDVAQSLKYQASLYKANDVIEKKAIKEAGSSIARLHAQIKKHPIIYAGLGLAGAGTIFGGFAGGASNVAEGL